LYDGMPGGRYLQSRESQGSRLQLPEMYPVFLLYGNLSGSRH